jgi:DNA-binding IclR family transcriptional regulator
MSRHILSVLETSTPGDAMPKPSSASTANAQPAATDGVAAIDRAMAILAALEAAGEPLTLAELASAVKLYKSTLLRLLASLRRCNIVTRRADQRYALGHFALRLGRAFEATLHVEESVVPVLEWLVSQGTESPSFHVQQDAKLRLCLYRIDSAHPTLDRVREGDLLPMNRGAPGKILSAFAKGAGSVSADTPLVRTSFGERDPSCGAVSAPVFGPDGELVGALSLSGPLERFSEVAVKRMSKLILIAAERATTSLGGEWPVAAGKARGRRPAQLEGSNP